MARPSLPEVELDVRDDLRNGREPFSRIMTSVDALGAEEMLHLRAIFEPAPLFKVLGKRGFSYESKQHGAEDWSVWFWRAESPASQRLPKCDGSNGAPKRGLPQHQPPLSDEQWIDVRDLEPPEPMVRTLAALEALPDGHMLVQVNARVPQFLLPILTERGFTFTIDESQQDRVLVRIRKPSGERPVSSSPAVELDVRVIQPREKHPTIFRTFDGLKSGESMVIINDHDPRPLRYQLMAERPDSFEWTYEAEGPETWRVRIDRK